jgi:hypothetical protein
MSMVSTSNGENALSGTGDSTLDLFYSIGSARSNPELAEHLFDSAMKDNPEVATGVLAWARDIRGGAGERNNYRKLLSKMIKENPVLAEKLIKITPQIGRYDDLNVAIGTPLQNVALEEWKKGLDANNELAYKWVSIKKDKELRRFLNMNPKQFRQYIVKGRPKIVEKKMCANEWGQITYEHVPSVCMNKRAKAFDRHDHMRFDLWKNDKTAKVNTSALYPYDVYKTHQKGERELAAKQWDNMKMEIKGNMIPIVDVSSSMSVQVAGQLSAMDIAISLGTYVSQRNTGPFKNKVITFHDNPQILDLPQGDVNVVFDFVRSMPWGGSTDFQMVYELLLNQAKAMNIPQDGMPDYLIVISDMEFNEAHCHSLYGRRVKVDMNKTGFGKMKEMFEKCGYKLPKIVFWNVKPANHVPTAKDEENVALISGFSPYVLQSVVSGNLKSINPKDIMMSVISKYMKLLDLPY